ncbi:MAG: type II toxin-antitoxin system RelE/ParE family toxin [Parasphingorhabdus sp.]
MIVRQTAEFSYWLKQLKDHEARARIIMRINRFKQGNLGDVKAVGEGVREARIVCGPGYRLYFIERGTEVLILLCGGSKKTQQRDIAMAKQLNREI